VVWFAEEAERLQQIGRSDHPDLALFGSWSKVQAYVRDSNEDGGDLKLMVDLVDSYGARELIRRLEATVEPWRAAVTWSTAHKSKGAEWPAVTLLDDYPIGERQTPEELRLLYVAVTRAQERLDCFDADLDGSRGAVDVLSEFLLKP
jgi:superfamily I DNA/RNA helicase